MAGIKTVFSCTKCDAQFPRWEGRCRECGSWDTLKARELTKHRSNRTTGTNKAVTFSSLVITNDAKRISTGSAELDRVLGGGVVPGALIFLGGSPGVGKSTLLLQVASQMAGHNVNQPVLYVSGEESGEQVRLRLDRLKAKPDNLHFLGDPTLSAITATVNETHPQLVIIDSLQTIKSASGTTAGRPSELRDAMESLMELAKTTATPIFVVGHVTKDGAVAGPKVLEHLVDAVLYFDTSDEGSHRVLSATKNRFGGVAEVGIWRMEEKGLVEIANPAAAFLSKKRPHASGTIILPILKGSRVFLVEIQALVTKTRFTHPQRRTTGFDLNRLQLLIAVLSKHLRLPLAYRDVHLNVVGGLKISEPAADLAVALAIISATQDMPLPQDMIVCGEVGLHGEIRPVPELLRRIETAARVRFCQAVVPEQPVELNTKAFTVYVADSITTAAEIALPRSMA